MAQNREIGELGQIVTVDTSSNSMTVNGSIILGNSTSNVVINSTAISFGGITQTDRSFTWTNTHTFTNTVSIAALSANGTLGLSSQVLTTNGTGIYWSSAGVNTNATYTWSNAHTFNGVVTFAQTAIGTVNNSLYLNGTDLSTLQGQITSNASAAYTNAVSYTDGKILTANSAITGNAATAYTNAVSYTDSKIGTANTAITGNAATAYTNATIFASNASNINTGTISEARLPYRMDQNVRTTDTVTLGNLTLTGNLYVGSNVNVIGANNLSIIDNMIYLNANNTITNPDLGFAGNYNDGTYAHAGFFRDASDSGTWKVFDNYLPEPDANSYIDTTNTSFHLANFQANTLNAGNTSTNWFIANTAGAYLTGTVNASSHTVGSGFVANSSGVYTNGDIVTTINNKKHAFTPLAGGSNAYFILQNDDNFVFYSTNTSNQPRAIFSIYANSVTSNLNFSVPVQFGANVGQFVANGSSGSAGQVLTSNGTSTYWATPAASGVTSVATGNGVTGGTITTTGTISVVAGTGTVVNATGVHVNSTYIGTLSANNTTYVNGKTEGNLNVNSATYATSAGSATNASAATNATYATSAGSATNATYATSAGSATNATNASNLGGTAAASYALLSGATFTGLIIGPVPTTSGVSAGNDTGSMSIRGDGTKSAHVSFHRAGAYAINVGLDTDNVFRFGGWSDGAATYRLSLAAPGGTHAFNGSITATGNITAYFSDIRLKTDITLITNALDKVKQLSGVNYKSNDVAAKYGYTDQAWQVGVLAQEVKKVLPEAVKPAPFDIKHVNGKEISISGENYMAVQYEKIIPLLIEAIKEQQIHIEKLEYKIEILTKNK